MIRLLRDFLLSTAVCLTLATSVVAQPGPFGNEWIDYDQPYYKLTLAQTGVYRVRAADLPGLPGNVPTERLRLYHRGQEVAIRTEGSGPFDGQDAFYFYGQRNDGTLDAELYGDAPQTNPYHNLFSDTAAYFLTWGDAPGQRIPTVEQTFTDAPTEEFFLNTTTRLFGGNAPRYTVGEQRTDKITSSTFVDGEGWIGNDIGTNDDNISTFTLTNLYRETGAPPIAVELMLVGRNNNSHRAEVRVGPNSNPQTLVTTADFAAGFGSHRTTLEVPATAVAANGTLAIAVKAVGTGPVDRMAIAYLRVTWPQTLSLPTNPSALTMTFPANADNTFKVNFQNVADNYDLYDISDPFAPQRRTGSLAVGQQLRLAFFNAPGDRRLFLTDTDSYLTPTTVVPTRFRPLDQTPAFVIISHPALMRPAGGTPDAVRAYAAYRASAAGGGYDTLVVSIDEVYDQFAYGAFTPVAIRNFARYLLAAGTPDYLFLVGKAINLRRRYDSTFYSRNLVPTFGMPGSDIAFTAGLQNDLYDPAIPTGRLVARNPDQVINYLDKVVTHEATGYTDNLWRKNFVHLSGGKTQNELARLLDYVQEHADIAESPLMGASVEVRNKETASVIENVNIADEVNAGLSLINVFGHSSVRETDVNIGLVSDPLAGFEEVGKFPFIIINGCQAGDIFTSNNNSISEDWILTPGKGSIGFIAHTDLGLSGELNRYTSEFYRLAFNDSAFFGAPSGVLQQQVIRNQQGPSPGLASYTLYQQFVLHGDPAVPIYSPALPDYAARRLRLEGFDGLNINAADSLQIFVEVDNYGRYLTDSLSVAVERRLPNGETLLVGPFSYPAPARTDTFQITLPAVGLAGAGTNRFRAVVDFNDDFAELSETNNTADLEFFVPASGLRALLPAEFSIVGSSPVRLIAQSSSLFDRDRSYLFELDTTVAFNSISRLAFRVTADRLATWEVSLPVTTDSTVYYWRARFEDADNPNEAAWSQSSFVYIADNPEGWSQSHVFQFRKDAQFDVRKNEALRRWEFITDTLGVEVTAQGSQIAGNVPGFNGEFSLLLDGGPLANTSQANPCTRFFNATRPTIYAVAFDQYSLRPYRVIEPEDVPGGDPFYLACGTQPPVINIFIQSGDGRVMKFDRLSQFVDQVNTGDYVLLVAAHNGGDAVKIDYQEDLGNLGLLDRFVNDLGANAANVNGLQPGDPYILFGQKGGAPNSALEAVANPDLEDENGVLIPTDSQRVTLSRQLIGTTVNGTITSTRIGPATAWGQFFHQVRLGTGDDYAFEVIGEDFQGRDTVLFSGQPTSPLPLAPVVNASQYPYLRLRARVQDSLNLTAPQLDGWQVTFEGLPEGIFTALRDDYDPGERVEGETFSLPFGFTNISTRDFPRPVAVRYEVSYPDGQVADTLTLGPLPAGDTLRFDLELPTVGRRGANSLLVYFNPQLQPEQYYENNAFQLGYNVTGDETNPVLDVAFDGARIMDGDIVAPQPVITVSLRDENPFLRIDDPENVRLFLRAPGAEFVQVTTTDPNLSWTAAEGRNEFQLTYQPEALTDGLHTLRVQGEDASGNGAGTVDYEINFEVVNASTITHFYPYPNPFSTSTRFVFTLTGSKVPDEFKVQIMTVTGRIVREIQKEELGPIRIGNNITEFAWDGTDQFGDRLSNGVYLYRVLLRDATTDFDHRETGGDQYFKQNFGKMYLLR